MGFSENLLSTAIVEKQKQDNHKAFTVTVANNRDYAPTVRTLIQKAKSSITIMLYQARFYEEYTDSSTNLFLHDLIDACNRGVQVRIVADTGVWNPQNGQKNAYLTNFLDMLTTSGVMVWEDNPQQVSHGKVMLVDDNLSLISSHNWSYYSTDMNNEVAVLADNEDINAYFKNYFIVRARDGSPRANVRPDSLDWESKDGCSLEELGFKTITVNEPAEYLDNRNYYTKMRDSFLDAKTNITLIQRNLVLYDKKPSFNSTKNAKPLPGEPTSPTNVLVSLLADLNKQGVKSTVILDKSNVGETEANAATAKALTNLGLTVLEDSATTQTHAKLVLIDNDRVVVGSTNWTWPAMETGNEVSVLFKSIPLNNNYKLYVENTVTSGTTFSAAGDSVWITPTFK